MFSPLLTSTLAVQRQTVAPDPSSGATRTWSPRSDLPAAIACRIEPADWRLAKQFARDDATVIYEVYTEIDLAVTRQDRLIVDGLAYMVEAYRPRTSFPGSTLTLCQTVVSRRN